MKTSGPILLFILLAVHFQLAAQVNQPADGRIKELSQKKKNLELRRKACETRCGKIHQRLDSIRTEGLVKYNSMASQWKTDCENQSWDGTNCQERKTYLENWRSELISALKKSRNDSLSCSKTYDSLFMASAETDMQLYALEQERKLNADFNVWLDNEQTTVRTSVEKNSAWKDELLKSVRESTDIPESCKITSLSKLTPGDILLVSPLEYSLKDNVIYVADRIYRRKPIEFEKGDKAYHTLTFIGRDAGGHTLYLDNTSGKGSHILSETAFKQEYKEYKIFVSRPVFPVDGKLILQAALDASRHTSDTKRLLDSDYGVFGKDDIVCSEKSAYVVFLARGTPSYEKQGLIDVTPNDFFDKEKLGKYFCMSTLPLTLK